MLNLNYNINNALGNGYCKGLLKYNYSASIEVIAGGGGGATDTLAGGGGGGGMAVSRSISIVPNTTYVINVGGGGAVDGDAQDSSLFGYDDVDNIPIAFYAEGGKKGLSTGNGGNSGTGSIVRNGVTTLYSGFTGGFAYTASNSFGAQKAAGGGASNAANGQNGNTVANTGGFGADGKTAGGGGGAHFIGPTGPAGFAGQQGNSLIPGYGYGGNGYSAQQSQQSNPRAATTGSAGAVIISYSGKQKAILTNATTTYNGATTTHIFNSGSGTFYYPIPYPWEEPVTPYQVIVCPPSYREN